MVPPLSYFDIVPSYTYTQENNKIKKIKKIKRGIFYYTSQNSQIEISRNTTRFNYELTICREIELNIVPSRTYTVSNLLYGCYISLSDSRMYIYRLLHKY